MPAPHRPRHAALLAAAALAVSCNTAPPVKTVPAVIAPVGAAAPTGMAPVEPAPLPSDPALGAALVIPADRGVVTVQAAEPDYALPESMKLWRGGRQPPGQKGAAPAKSASGASAKRVSVESEPVAVQAAPAVATVNAGAEEPRYALPASLNHWHGTRTAPLYADPNVEQWQAAPTEARLKNAAVSCNYKDEGGVRGKVMLLVDDYKVSRFNARIEMPNGGVCQFDAKQMKQRPFEQGLALESKNDECVVRMWEQKHRITVAAYNCHRQCSKGSFSYLWPILMDTRLGTCY
jgi:hypothetical protein